MDKEGVPDSAILGVEQFQLVIQSWADISGGSSSESRGTSHWR